MTASFAAACFHAVLGEQGSGKHVLLRLLGLLETPDSGDVILSGIPVRRNRKPISAPGASDLSLPRLFC